MSSIELRRPRIIPRDDDPGTPEISDPYPRRYRQSFDYASLLGRQRARLRLTGTTNAHGETATSTVDTANAYDTHVARNRMPVSNGYSELPWNSPTFDEHAGNHIQSIQSSDESADRHALRARLTGAAAPIVSAVYRQQQHFLQLIVSLAREVAAFCGDPSIVEAGNWEVQLPLDQSLFPQTTLYLSLSHFSLQLRFNASDSTIRQLLLDQSALLERELDILLRAWGEVREIELTVW